MTFFEIIFMLLVQSNMSNGSIIVYMQAHQNFLYMYRSMQHALYHTSMTFVAAISITPCSCTFIRF